ncbi:SRPBCC family protein [Rhodococcus indonesiensis]|uniref:SRPBCC family protein n=1 Tax=Rhodococcus indonesiensis TaxID=3055869 RepID=UPI0039F6FCBC
MGHHIELSRSVDAPSDRVWRVLTSVDSAPQVLSGVDSVERLAGVGYEVGTRWRETRRMFGRAATEEMTVTAVEPGRHTVVEAESGGVRYRTEFDVAPDRAGTMLTVRFSADDDRPGRIRRALTALLAPLGMRVTRTALRRDLDDIAAAARAGI